MCLYTFYIVCFYMLYTTRAYMHNIYMFSGFDTFDIQKSFMVGEALDL